MTNWLPLCIELWFILSSNPGCTNFMIFPFCAGTVPCWAACLHSRSSVSKCTSHCCGYAACGGRSTIPSSADAAPRSCAIPSSTDATSSCCPSAIPTGKPGSAPFLNASDLKLTYVAPHFSRWFIGHANKSFCCVYIRLFCLLFCLL